MMRNVSIIVDFAEKINVSGFVISDFWKISFIWVLLEWSIVILVVEGRDYDSIFLAFNNEGLQREAFF